MHNLFSIITNDTYCNILTNRKLCMFCNSHRYAPQSYCQLTNIIEIHSSDGVHTLQKQVPDTITSWVITAFALDPVTGLAITQQPTKLRVFQPFFVSLTLPYSVKRGEVVSVPIAVFNYMESAVNAEVTLHNEDQDFEFVEISNELTEAPASKCHLESSAVHEILDSVTNVVLQKLNCIAANASPSSPTTVRPSRS